MRALAVSQRTARIEKERLEGRAEKGGQRRGERMAAGQRQILCRAETVAALEGGTRLFVLYLREGKKDLGKQRRPNGDLLAVPILGLGLAAQGGRAVGTVRDGG